MNPENPENPQNFENPQNLDARPIRPGEQVEWPRLIEWLRTRLRGCDIVGLDVSADPAVAQFPGGHSNLTYLIRFGNAEIVIRRPPLGPVPPGYCP